jgi:hypothetical protein
MVFSPPARLQGRRSFGCAVGGATVSRSKQFGFVIRVKAKQNRK